MGNNKTLGILARLENKRVFIGRHPKIKNGICIEVTGLYDKELKGTTFTISEKTHFKKHKAKSGICITEEVFKTILQAGALFLEEEEKRKYLNKLN